MLVVNTVLVGLMMASFALASADQPLWLRLVQLAFFGGVNSMQFTAMNTLTLKDLGTGGASSGNSLFSLVQMLSMSLGVTVAGAMLATFTGLLPRVTETNSLPAFHATFLCVGIITAATAWIFGQLAPEIRAPRRKDRSVGIELSRDAIRQPADSARPVVRLRTSNGARVHRVCGTTVAIAHSA